MGRSMWELITVSYKCGPFLTVPYPAQRKPKLKVKAKMRSVYRRLVLELTSRESTSTRRRNIAVQKLISNFCYHSGEWERR